MRAARLHAVRCVFALDAHPALDETTLLLYLRRKGEERALQDTKSRLFLHASARRLAEVAQRRRLFQRSSDLFHRDARAVSLVHELKRLSLVELYVEDRHLFSRNSTKVCMSMLRERNGTAPHAYGRCGQALAHAAAGPAALRRRKGSKASVGKHIVQHCLLPQRGQGKSGAVGTRAASMD